MAAIYIFDGMIEDVSSERDTTFLIVSYMQVQENRGMGQTVRIAVSPRTIVLNMNGVPVREPVFSVGMMINAVVSPTMSRSIPPQTTAYLVDIVTESMPENIVTGRIVNVDRNERNFTVIRDQDSISGIRFNVPEDAQILDKQGRPMNFLRLVPGMRVRVRHADFMTASIPPQTTAFEVQVL